VPLREDATAGRRAEVEYPDHVSDSGRCWLRTKPFGNAPRETARHLIDFGYLVQLLEVHAGMRVCELGCGSGWLTCYLARAGAEAKRYDISPGMIEIARERAQAEHVDAHFEVADFEGLDLDRRFDACVVYDALHHSPRPRARARLRPPCPAARRRPRARRAEPEAAIPRPDRDAGVRDDRARLLAAAHQASPPLGRVRGVERFQNNRKRLYGPGARDVVFHLVEPIIYRLLAPFWTQVWIRARAR
jgi:SAM-dependent methyltransferase